MPQFLAAVGANILAGVGVAVYTGTTLGLALAITVGSIAVVGAANATRNALRGNRLRDAGDGGLSNRAQQLLVRSTTEPRKIVYGEALVSGPLVWMNTNGDSPTPNGALYSIIALTGHEIDSFQGFYLDDKFVPIADVDTAGDGDIDDDTNSHGFGPVGGTAVLYFRGHLGTAGQTVDTMVDSGFTLWTSNHRGRGVAYVVVRMDQMEGAEEVWENGAPGNISVLVRGKKVYDPRLDSTFTGSWGTGSGAHRVATPSTWAYSTNPALCLADYLIDSDLGVGIPTAKIDYNDVAFAADDCDDAVSIPTSTTQARFTCNGVLSCLDSHRENIEKILSSMAGTLRRYGGQYHISAGVWPTASSFTLTESHLVGPIMFQAQPERTERFNSVRGLYFDPSRQYKESQYLQVEDTTLQTDRDDGQVLWKDLDLPMTNNEYTAQRLAFRAVAQAALPGVVVFPTGYNGLNIAVGDRGTVTISELGWSSKNFRCIGLEHVDMVGVKLTLKEDEATAYIDPDEADYGTRTGATVVDFPRVRRNLESFQGVLLADPFFSRSVGVMPGADTDYRSYFWRINPANHHANSTAVISRTGGVTGDGVLQLTADAFSGGTRPAQVASIPYEGQLSVAGEYVIVNVRLRRTSASLTTNAANAIIINVGLGDQDGIIGNFGGDSAFTIDQTTVAGWTQNQWKQFSFRQQLGLESLTSFSGPYCIADIMVVSQNEALPIEVDAITVQRTEGP